MSEDESNYFLRYASLQTQRDASFNGALDAYWQTEQLLEDTQYIISEYGNPNSDAKSIGGNIAKVRGALSRFIEGKPYLQDLESFLSRFSKKSKRPNLQNYVLKQDHGAGQKGKSWNDCPYSFVLLHQESPIAVTGFVPRRNAVLIEQIQGVKGCYRELCAIKWERALVAIVCYWAKESGIPQVQVLPSEKNEWAHVRKTGKLRYDVTAKRMGFVYNKKSKVYIKSVA